jgi:hypothetical protein
MRAKGVGCSPSGSSKRLRQQRGKDGFPLDHGERAADADARAGAERHIGAAMALGFRLRREARRIETERVPPQAPVAVHHIDRDGDGRSCAKLDPLSVTGASVRRMSTGAGGKSRIASWNTASGKGSFAMSSRSIGPSPAMSSASCRTASCQSGKSASK